MDSLRATGVVLIDRTRFRVLPSAVIVEGRIDCEDGVIVEAQKELELMTDEGERSWVKTRTFRYQAWKRGSGNILRCESAGSHRDYPHTHVYPTAGSDENTLIEHTDPEDIPTLSEFIEDVHRAHIARERG